MPKPIFEESQRFSGPWLWLVVAASVAIGLLGLLSSTPHWLASASVIVIPVLITAIRLKVRVFHDAIDIRFIPMTRRRISLRDVASADARTYAPIREYRGWGVKGTRTNRAYNVSGKHGVQLVLRDDTKVLIGSQKSDDLAKAINDQLEQRT